MPPSTMGAASLRRTCNMPTPHYPARPTKIYINSQQGFIDTSTWSALQSNCWDAEYIDATDVVALREALDHHEH